MKKQIDAFNTALAAFDTYAQMLQDAAAAIREGDRRDDLIVSLMRPNTDILPPDIIEKLLEGSRGSEESFLFIKRLLAKADVIQAIQSTLTHSRSLDRELESTLDLQSPAYARIPPPYRFFEPAQSRLLTAFPRDLDDPVDTPQRRAFQRYLETAHNPWQ